MDFLREEVSDAGESSLYSFAIIVFQKSLPRLILLAGVTFAADLKFYLVTLPEQIFQFIAGVGTVGV